MSATPDFRSRHATFMLIAGVGGTLALFLAACAPSPGITASQGTPGAAPTSQSSEPAASPVAAATATATVPASAAKPAPTQGGVPPTVVGRSQPTVVANAQLPSGTATPQPAVHITVTANQTFDPPKATVAVGETVQWVNLGRAPQTITGDPGKVQNKANALLPPGAQPWDSGVLNTGQTFAHRFDAPGDYTYTSLPAEGQGLVGHITVH